MRLLSSLSGHCIAIFTLYALRRMQALDLAVDDGVIEYNPKWSCFKDARDVAAMISDVLICLEMFLIGLAHAQVFICWPMGERSKHLRIEPRELQVFSHHRYIEAGAPVRTTLQNIRLLFDVSDMQEELGELGRHAAEHIGKPLSAASMRFAVHTRVRFSLLVREELYPQSVHSGPGRATISVPYVACPQQE